MIEQIFSSRIYEQGTQLKARNAVLLMQLLLIDNETSSAFSVPWTVRQTSERDIKLNAFWPTLKQIKLTAINHTPPL